MQPRRRHGIPLISILLLILVCLVLAGGVWAVEQVPVLAEREFGPASPALGAINRLVYSARVLFERDDLLTAANPVGQVIQFEIAPGESANSVIYRLEQSGLVRNAEALRTFLIYAGLDTGIQAGKYELNPAETAVEIARQIQKAAPGEAVLVILPGWRAEEVAAALPTSGLTVSPLEFLQAVRNPPAALVPASLQPLANLEGYLFPGEYRLPRETTMDELITAILGRFESALCPEMLDAFAARGLSLQQAVTLAAIVQKEGVVDEERPMIASVFYNRLAAGMKLDSDPTVQFVLGYNDAQKTWWTNPLSADQMGIDSPYNTYLYAGLPPGPICSPGLSALQAVAFPAESPYYYFRSKCDGSGYHNFSVTFEEHVGNACP